MKYLFALVVAFFLVLGNAPSARAQDEVTFLIPAPTKVVMDKLLPAFEAKTGYKVKVTYGMSLTTRDQVAKGEPFDVPVLRAPYDAALASGNILRAAGPQSRALWQESACARVRPGRTSRRQKPSSTCCSTRSP